MKNLLKDEIEKLKILLKEVKTIEEYPELIELIQSQITIKEKEKKFISTNKDYVYGNMYTTRYGVCHDFAKEFEDLCRTFKLPCTIVRGNILSDGIECGHAWNAIMINGKTKYIDISSAIHCKDGHNNINSPYDFFNKSFTELTQVDNGKNRTIDNKSQILINQMIQKLPGWNYSD